MNPDRGLTYRLYLKGLRQGNGRPARLAGSRLAYDRSRRITFDMVRFDRLGAPGTNLGPSVARTFRREAGPSAARPRIPRGSLGNRRSTRPPPTSSSRPPPPSP